MKKLFSESIQIIRQNWKAYLWINILYYGTIIIGVIYSQLNPSLHTKAISILQNSFIYGFYSTGYDLYYIHRNVPLAILLTFSINLFLGTLIHITIPSLLIPFFGFIVSLYRAFGWGFIFSSTITSPFILGLNILEGQGYIIATFGVYLLAVRFLNPSKYNLPSHKKGYIIGLKMLTKLYVLVISVLFVSACYEVAISGSNILFPNESYSEKQLGFSGSRVKMKFSDSYIYYDSITVNKNDAKVLGILLEDALYLKSDTHNAAMICASDSGYEIQLYLDDKCWGNGRINNKFISIEKELSILNGKPYRIKAFCEDSSGRKKVKYF